MLVPGTYEVTLLADLDLVDQKDNTTLFSLPLSYSSQLCGFLLLTHVPTWQSWTLCIDFLILRSGQLSQSREDPTSRATAHSWNRFICGSTRDIPASLVITGPSLRSAAGGSCSCQQGNLGCEAAAHCVVLRGNHQADKQEAALQWAATCETICRAQRCCPQRKRTAVGATQNTADEELLLPDPAPRPDRGHTIPCSEINALIPRTKSPFPWYGSWYPKFQLVKFPRDQWNQNYAGLGAVFWGFSPRTQ